MTEENYINDYFAYCFAVMVFISFIRIMMTFDANTALLIISFQYLFCGCIFYIVIKSITQQKTPNPIKFIFLWYPAIFSDKLKVQMYKRE